MKKYTVTGQNVYVTHNDGCDESYLFCIAVNIENAIEIAATLNVFTQFETKKDEPAKQRSY